MKQAKIERTGEKLTLPPYGYMNNRYMWDVHTRRVPDKFTLAGRAATPAEWLQFVERLVDEIADFLWPRFDRDTQKWEGRAEPLGMALTRADLDLLQKPVLAEMLLSPVGDGPKQRFTHKGMFAEEDEGKPGTLFPTLDPYMAMMPAETIVRLKEAMARSLGGFGPAPLRFKEYFQRPRPYQAAFVMKRAFSLELAASSMTPSLLSGHALQGLIGGCGGFMAIRLQIQDAPHAEQELQQFCADFGDRRVFAGVHYPSDNICSWYCALRLCDNLFGEAGQVAKNFVWQAVQGSIVYKAIEAEVDKYESSAFAVPLKRLLAEAKRPAEHSEP